MNSKELKKLFVEIAPNIRSEIARNKAVIKVVDIIYQDMDKLMTDRNIGTDSGCIGVINDALNKWKSLSRKLKAHYGISVLKSDGFLLHLKNEIPIVYDYYQKQTTQGVHT